MNNVEKEIWKNIPGYEGYYMASNMGRIKSLDHTVKGKRPTVLPIKGRIMKPCKSKVGKYLNILLCIDGKSKCYLAHRLIAMTFLNDWQQQLTVNHINGNKLDNRAENLEMCTSYENMRHAIKHGLVNNNGTNSHHAKLSNSQVEEIRIKYAQKTMNQYELADSYGVCQGTIWKIVHNVSYKT